MFSASFIGSGVCVTIVVVVNFIVNFSVHCVFLVCFLCFGSFLIKRILFGRKDRILCFKGGIDFSIVNLVLIIGLKSIFGFIGWVRIF